MLVNQRHVKEFVKGYCLAKRPRFTRVSKTFLNDLDAHLRDYISKRIHSLPSVGKTVK